MIASNLASYGYDDDTAPVFAVISDGTTTEAYFPTNISEEEAKNWVRIFGQRLAGLDPDNATETVDAILYNLPFSPSIVDGYDDWNDARQSIITALAVAYPDSDDENDDAPRGYEVVPVPLSGGEEKAE